MRQQWLAASWRIGGAGAQPRGPSCQARFPAEIIESRMYCPRSVAFFMLLRMWNEGDVPRGASEIERVTPRRKASFLQPALEFLMIRRK